MNLKNLVNNCFLVVSNEKDIIKINKAKEKYNKENILILFFHYNKNNYKSDYDLIKNLENKTNMYINFIDISNLYIEKLKIIDKLNLYSDNIEEHKNLRKEVVLKQIIDNIKDEINQYKEILEFT